MKKIVFLILIILIIVLIPNTEAETIKIPKESIRIRVIANSESKNDQQIKTIVRKNLETEVYDLLKDVNNITTARKRINDSLNQLSNNVKNTLITNNFDSQYQINFGKNYFPEKEYKGVIYEAGMYESLVVTLGTGKGSNWWCVLFPPLCLIEAEENENIDDVEYKFFIKKIIDKYLK